MFRPARKLLTRWSLILPLSLLLGLSCSTRERPADDGPYIVATLPVIAHLVRPVAGDDLPVRILVDRPVSPHAYELRPSEARLVAGATGVFAASRGVDGWISSYAGRKVHMLFDGSGHGWTDPVLAAEAVRSAGLHLCTLFPDDCPAFERRAVEFADSLAVLAETIRTRTGAIRPGTVALSEPFFAPFLRRFDLGADTILRTVPEHDPSPASVRRAADGAAGIRAIIVPSTIRDRLAEELADVRGWELILIDPIGLEYIDYFSWLEASVDSLLTGTSES